MCLSWLESLDLSWCRGQLVSQPLRVERRKSLNKQRARHSHSYLSQHDVAEIRKKLPQGSKATAMNLALWIHERKTLAPRQLQALYISRVIRSKLLGCLLRDARCDFFYPNCMSIFYFSLFFFVVCNQTIGGKKRSMKSRGSISWPRVRSRRDKTSTDSTTRRDGLYRSTDYYSPLSPARGNSWRRHRSIILPMGKAIDNANGCALGNRLNECLQESNVREPF